MDYIENSVPRPHPWFKAICLNNRPIGAIFRDKNSGNNICRGELSYVLASLWWGKGFANGYYTYFY
jgi:uncharacterized membrane protein|uniref:N-acetyltransferase domain-containing protein n=1 Tax=Populus trichocarpa TaxID=3694 RepID=B9NBP1_POPTR